MFARLLALVCLLQFGLCVGRSEPVAPSDHPLLVYLHTGSFRNSPALPYMQQEVSGLMQVAGYRVEFQIAGESPAIPDAAELVVVELRGVCKPPDPSAPIKPLEDGAALASTAMADGKILPFTWVNCGTLSQLLGHRVDGPRASLSYGRAMGRVLAHELYHILANERHHAGSGIAKSAFSARDLLGEHFKFERTALASLRLRAPAPLPLELKP